MAKHKVLMTTPPREVKRADVSFQIERDGKLFGTLEISNGSVVWYPAGTTYGSKVGWRKFHEIMEDNATRFESR